MTAKKSLSFLFISLLCWACSSNKENALWENMPVVAKKVEVGNGSVITLNPDLLKDTTEFPISYFIEELEFVKLDSRDEALVAPSQRVVISDNYILILSESTPCKLFDKQGRYLNDIGSVGGGPGEYNRYITLTQIDEENKRIYLYESNKDNILTFNLAGEALPSIPLPAKTNCMFFEVRSDLVKIVNQPTDTPNNLVWKQTLDGSIMDSIPSAHLTFAKGTWSFGTNNIFTDNIAIHFAAHPGQQDTLYHVDFGQMKLIPQFTMDYSNRKMQTHNYTEWAHYFVGSTSEQIHTVTYTPEGGQSRSVEGDPPLYYIVDKKTLKGSFLRIHNDYLDGIDAQRPAIRLFGNGYYVKNMDPGNLAELLEEILAAGKLDEKRQTRYTQLLESIGEDDNNYIVYARMKQ